jgi:hypothetical protein
MVVKMIMLCQKREDGKVVKKRTIKCERVQLLYKMWCYRRETLMRMFAVGGCRCKDNLQIWTDYYYRFIHTWTRASSCVFSNKYVSFINKNRMEAALHVLDRQEAVGGDF